MTQLTQSDYLLLFGTRNDYDHANAMDKYNASLLPQNQIRFTIRQAHGKFVGVVTYRDELPESLLKTLEAYDLINGFRRVA